MHSATFAPISSQVTDYETDPRLDHGTKAFLKEINAPGGAPLETLPLQAAQDVLVNLQASVAVDLFGVEVSQKTISSDGYTIPLHVVRPAGVKHKFCVNTPPFFHPISLPV